MGGNLDWRGTSAISTPTAGAVPGTFSSAIRDARGSQTAADGTINPYSGTPDQIDAAILRGQGNDWFNIYQPIADSIMNQTTYNTPGLVDQNVNSAISTVNSNFDASAQQQQRSLSRYGVSADPDQAAYLSRANNLSRSSSIVDAANNIRTNLADRNRAIATGGLSSGGYSATASAASRANPGKMS